MNLYPNNLKNWLLGLAKASIIDDRKLIRIGLIRTNLRSLRPSILKSFRSSRKANFSSCLGISDIRKEIDQIDEKIIALLKQRLDRVIKLKDKKKSLTDPERESQILSRIDSIYIQNIYREIFQNSKRMLIDQGFTDTSGGRVQRSEPH